MLRGIWQEICFWTFWLFPLSLSPFLSSHYFSVRPWGCVQALCPSLEWDTHHGVWTLISRSSPWPRLCLSLPPFPVNICFLLNPHSRDRGNPGAFFDPACLQIPYFLRPHIWWTINRWNDLSLTCLASDLHSEEPGSGCGLTLAAASWWKLSLLLDLTALLFGIEHCRCMLISTAAPSQCSDPGPGTLNPVLLTHYFEAGLSHRSEEAWVPSWGVPAGSKAW